MTDKFTGEEIRRFKACSKDELLAAIDWNAKKTFRVIEWSQSDRCWKMRSRAVEAELRRLTGIYENRFGDDWRKRLNEKRLNERSAE